MEMDFNKLITYKNVNKAIIGESYYAYEELTGYNLHHVKSGYKITLAGIDNLREYEPFLDYHNAKYAFLYPIED